MTRRTCPHCGEAFEVKSRCWVWILITVGVTFAATCGGLILATLVSR